MPQRLTIPEDPRLAERLREAAGRDALSHAILLSGAGDLLRAARFTAAAMECQGTDKPCGRCLPCEKVLRDIHPDVVTVADPEHKNISMDVLRDIRADAYILPNEGRRKVYIFPDCGILDPKGQNVLLKVLEEGPPHAAFILCARNSSVLLPTIRSRVEEWRLMPPEEDPTADSGAKELCLLIARRDAGALTAYCADLESDKIQREELQALLSDARDILTAALAAVYRGSASPLIRQLAQEMGRRRLADAIAALEKLIPQCAFNVGVGHLTGALAVALTK